LLVPNPIFVPNLSASLHTPTIQGHPGKNGAIILKVTGEVRHEDQEGKGVLHEALNGHIDKGATRLILDMHNRAWIDSLALGIIIEAGRRLRPLEKPRAPIKSGPDPNADLKIVVPLQAPFRKILSVAKLDEVFMVFPSIPEAEASFNEPPRLARR